MPGRVVDTHFTPILNILIVDNRPADIKRFERHAMSTKIDGYGVNVISATDAGEAVAVVRRSTLNVAFIDDHLGSEDSLEIVRLISRVKPNLPIVILTREGTSAGSVTRYLRVADDCVVREALSPDVIAKTVARVLNLSTDQESSGNINDIARGIKVLQGTVTGVWDKVEDMGKEIGEVGEQVATVSVRVEKLETQVDSGIFHVCKNEKVIAGLVKTAQQDAVEDAAMGATVGNIEDDVKEIKSDISTKVTEINDSMRRREERRRQWAIPLVTAAMAVAVSIASGIGYLIWYGSDLNTQVRHDRTTFTKQIKQVTDGQRKIETKVTALSGKTYGSDEDPSIAKVLEELRDLEASVEKVRTTTSEKLLPSNPDEERVLELMRGMSPAERVVFKRRVNGLATQSKRRKRRGVPKEGSRSKKYDGLQLKPSTVT